jgi:hypothetical protein
MCEQMLCFYYVFSCVINKREKILVWLQDNKRAFILLK